MEIKPYLISCTKCGFKEPRKNARPYVCMNCTNPKLYGRGWDVARKMVLARDKVCQVCGVNRRLNVHHKDKNRKNHNLDNLILLCISCHLSQHGTNFAPIVAFQVGQFGTRLQYGQKSI